ncbi:AAA family ATPase [Brevibacillus marinus]|uniref:AAA family ATPase n=1 Tax=Brevibacillus marinus TaxID=2496837 RepID=UPI000F81B824|nr:AAA family ATPase [Brevibacillus marinus]
MLATQTHQEIFSVVPLKQDGVKVVAVEDLPSIVQQDPHAIVYLLWPEHKHLIHSLIPAKVYVLGENPKDMEQVKAAIRAGAEDYLDRNEFLKVEEKTLEEQVIRLTPRIKEPSVKITSTSEKQFPSLAIQDVKPTEREFETILNYSRFDDLHRKPIGGRQTIVVTSTKGGIGKTTIAMNLARLLHDSGRGRVILVDLMHPHGNIATRMKIQPEINVKTWEPYMNRKTSLMDQQIMQQLVIKAPNGMYLLPSVNPGEICSPELADYILMHLNKVFDFVIVDIGPERQDILTRAMTTATKTLLVADYDLATIKDILDYAEVWYRRALSLEKVNVVVNFEPTKRDGNSLTREKCMNYLHSVNLKTIGFLPETQGMRRIHNLGKVLVQEDAKHPFTKGLEGIVRQLIPDYQQNSKKQSFFSKLFGR